MKKFILAASSTALALSSLAGPASAQEIQEFLAPTVATFVDPNPELSAMCVIKPGDNSGFVALATDIQISTSTTTVDTGPSVASGLGTAVITHTIAGPAHKHGQSVNIFAFITDKATFPQTLLTTPTKTTVTTTTSFNCHVHKPTSGNDQEELHPGFKIAPLGLQGDPVSTSTDSVTTGFRTQTVNQPFVVVNKDGEDGVICISPTKNPGVWRTANGYNNVSLGACSTALYTAVGGETPSVSVPMT